MVFMLIDMKNPNSFFRPYYDILPTTLSNMPIFWDTNELKYLEGSYLLEQIEERNIAIESDYEAICNLASNFRETCTLHEFKWARMCVCSRNFGLIINGIQTAALVPYADMLNHYRPRETKWQFDDQLQGFTVVSLQHIGPGAQVYDSYGRKCNHRFLLNYGFSVENNIEADGFCPNEVRLLFLCCFFLLIILSFLLIRIGTYSC
jgi:histone-lysine N-methyltransferase SETD3